MATGMITLHNNGDMERPRRRKHKFNFKIKVETIKPWEARKGHKEDRADTTFDNRPKRQRTRKAIDKQWRDEYDI